ncbi:GAL4 [Geosmithia morbida]|uniref:GAL4 n=1 Tax=Geosmithia morbida TaxID=1094350 RepID=A0A9P4Z079_9HYPO|nr:GAL4 [Geosmithia morbida]KAF4125017.1 GAL4 [Geosmithia morbida]
MKLTLGFTAVLAGCAAAAAAAPAADVYILSNDEAAVESNLSVSPSEARLILLQRLAPAGRGASTAEIPHSADTETLVTLLNKYGGGGAEQPLFMPSQSQQQPSQLVVMLEGMTDEQIEETGHELNTKPSFTIADAPSPKANDKFVSDDIYAHAGVSSNHECSVNEITNPFEERCWSGRSTVAKYNVQKNPEILSDLTRQISNLAKLARSGEMETTLVLFPASASAKKWSEVTLHRRQSTSEQVISSSYAKAYAPDVSSSPKEEDHSVFYKSSGASTSASIPACFSSEDSCVTATGNCSGHGSCTNKYGSSSKDSCFACHCLSSINEESGSLTHWAGKTCSKEDVSVAFWLFAGFTLVMVFILTTCVGMLYSVGEEKLPGVLGAGVSKSSS